MKVTIELDWERASVTTKDGWLMFVPLPSEYIEEIFPALDEEQRRLCITAQTIAPNLVDRWWVTFTADERMLVLQHQKVAQRLAEEVWAHGAAWQEAIAWSQHLPMSFIERAWDSTTNMAKCALLLKQDIPLEFVCRKWAEMSKEQKAAAWGIQTEQLDSVSDKELREATEAFIEEMDKHITMWVGKETIPKDTLPGLLTSSNKFIRALAAGYMDREVKEEEE